MKKPDPRLYYVIEKMDNGYATLATRTNKRAADKIAAEHLAAKVVTGTKFAKLLESSHV